MQQADLPVLDTQPIPFLLEDALLGEVQRAGGAPL
jgi:ABC-2 type transport system ATP-binding protein